MKKWIVGFLVLVLLSASVYVLLPDKIKIDVQKTRTKYFVWEDDSWTLAATEYVNLFDATKKMRAKSRSINHSVVGDVIKIVRTSVWKDNISTVQTYTFDGSVDDVELVPISNVFECFNCVGKIVHFEFRDILYEGVTRVAFSPESFGHSMTVEWESGNYYAKIFQQKVASDKLIIRYRPSNIYESYNVRIFDPLPLGISDNLVGYWNLDGSAIDSSGFDNDGTVSGAKTSRGVKGRAFKFDGVDDYIRVLASSSLSYVNVSVSVSMWFKSAGAYTVQQRLYWSRANGGDIYFVSGRVQVYLDVGAIGMDSGIVSYDALWHQVVLVNDIVSNKSYVYIDGVEKDNDIASYVVNAPSDTYIGSVTGSSNFFNGTIDEVRIYNRSLSAQEVSELYNSNRSYKKRVVNSANLGLVDMTDNVLWMDMDRGATDKSGFGNDGTVTGAVLTKGRFGNGYSFDGVVDNIVVSGSVIDNLIDSFSVSVWLKTNGAGDTGDHRIIGADANDFVIFEDGGDHVMGFLFNLNESDDCSIRVDANTKLDDDIWTYIAVVYNGVNLSVYKNGVFTTSDTCNGSLVDIAGSLDIGCPSNQCYNGSIDEVLIFNRSLSATEIALLYNGEKSPKNIRRNDPSLGLVDMGGNVLWMDMNRDADDKSGFGNDGTVTGALLSKGRFGNSYEFDGIDDYINLGDFDDDWVTFTACGWRNGNLIEQNGYVLSSRSNSGFRLGEGTSGTGLFIFGAYNSSGSEVLAQFQHSGGGIGWTHLCGVHNGTDIKLYVDGTLKINVTINGYKNSTVNLVLGALTPTPSSVFNGSIDEVQIFDRALSAQEILGLYNGEKSRKMIRRNSPG